MREAVHQLKTGEGGMFGHPAAMEKIDRNKQLRAYPYNKTPRRNVLEALGFLRSLYFQHASAMYSGMQSGL